MANESRLTTEEIVERYVRGDRVGNIAEDAGITRIAVWKRIKSAGVPSRKPKFVTMIDLVCTHCGNTFQRRKGTPSGNRPFCSADCYADFMRQSGSGYIEHRHGCRLARKIVAEVFDLKPWHVVHHHDKNNDNNDLSNLAVFECRAAHMSFHKGGDAKPIWDGASCYVPEAQCPPATRRWFDELRRTTR